MVIIAAWAHLAVYAGGAKHPSAVLARLRSPTVSVTKQLAAMQMQEPSVRLHLVAALQSLQRESELLDSTQVDLVLAMLQDSGAASLTPPRRASSRRF